MEKFIELFSDSFSYNEKESLRERPMDKILFVKTCYEVEEVLKTRSDYRNKYLSCAVGINILKWWAHHSKIINVARTHPDWDEDKLIINLTNDKYTYHVNPDYRLGKVLLDIMMVKPSSSYIYCGGISSDNVYLDLDYVNYSRCNNPLPLSIIKFFRRVYDIIVCEDFDDSNVWKTLDVNISKETVLRLKEEYPSIQSFNQETRTPHNELSEEFGSDVKKFTDIFTVYFLKKIITSDDISYSDYRENLNRVIREIEVLFNPYEYCYNLLLRSILCELRCFTLTNNIGQSKIKLINKIISIIEIISNIIIDKDTLTSGAFFNVQSIKNYSSVRKYDFTFYEDVKKRREGGDGYYMSRSIGYDQCLDLLVRALQGGDLKLNCYISFHPCDLITSSLGNSWSSCHSFVNIQNAFMREHNIDPNCGSTYRGMYHLGNFDYMTGDAFIVYEPHDSHLSPAYFVPKVWRMFMFINSDFTAIRQNCIYPGKKQDKILEARSKTIREIIQELVNPFNGKTEGQTWLKTKKEICDLPFDEVCPQRFRGYNYNTDVEWGDPSECRSYLQGCDSYSDIMYGGDPVYWNGPNTIIEANYNCSDEVGYISTSLKSCEYCGKYLESGERHFCSDCKEHHHDLFFKINNSTSYYTYEQYLNALPSMKYCEDTKQYEDHYISYYDGNEYHYRYKDVSDLCQCKSCGRYFTVDYMEGSFCKDHYIKNADDIDAMIELFKDKQVVFTTSNMEKTRTLLLYMEDTTDICWASGKKPSEFIPNSNKVLGMFMTSSGMMMRPLAFAKVRKLDLESEVQL